jgi:hypothetical protein
LLRIFNSDSKLRRWRLFVNLLFRYAARAAAAPAALGREDDNENDKNDPNDTANNATDDGIYSLRG